MSKLIPINIGLIDQVLRGGISLALIYIGLIDHSIIQDGYSRILIGIAGILNLVVATVRYCPLYAVTGINTASHTEQ